MGSLQAGGVYALRKDVAPSNLDKAAARLIAPIQSWRSSRFLLSRILPSIYSHSERFEAMSDDQLRGGSTELRYRLKATQLSRPVVAEAFALIREVAGRRLSMRHFDVQLVGGWAMLNGMIAEMETGEGKTLTATLAAGTAALSGIPVHVITVNDYLAERDAAAMRPIYEALGLTVGASLAEMSDSERRVAYACDITYTTNKQVAFDHLRDRIQLRGCNTQLGLNFIDHEQRPLLLRGLHFALIDEADSVLVDEAVTPLIISKQGQPAYAKEILVEALTKAKSLVAGQHFDLQADSRLLTLSTEGKEDLKEWAQVVTGLWRNTRYREQLIMQALRALYLFECNWHYLVDEGKVKIIDEFTGRLMADRSWEQGLHQLIEVKEGCEITGEMETIGRISYQRFFRRYQMLGGMSGTVHEVASELRSVYGLSVARIPTHRKSQRHHQRPRVMRSDTEKWQQVIESIRLKHAQGRPVLVGTRSVGASEYLSGLLENAGIEHCVLNARQDAEEARVVALAGARGQITVATNMAGRGTDIILGADVAKFGGLHVIATERHEARRIDRQLFGRCARQGDPGSYEEIGSLEDELVCSQLSPWLRRTTHLLLTMGSWPCEAIVILLLKYAQTKAQRRSIRIRIQMQKMDEYLENVLAFTGRLE
ncbi:MAG: hypothetical protein V7629_18955 [Motiliproteus sp.]